MVSNKRPSTQSQSEGGNVGAGGSRTNLAPSPSRPWVAGRIDGKRLLAFPLVPNGLGRKVEQQGIFGQAWNDPCTALG